MTNTITTPKETNTAFSNEEIDFEFILLQEEIAKEERKLEEREINYEPIRKELEIESREIESREILKEIEKEYKLQKLEIEKEYELQFNHTCN